MKPRHKPPQRPEQVFQFGRWIFNVDKAQALLVERPREPAPLPVQPWARQYGLDLVGQPGRMPTLGVGPDFDADYAMTTDLGRPVILATLRSAEHGAYPLLIDGTHRLYRAYCEGVSELPAYFLTEAETQAVRMW